MKFQFKVNVSEQDYLDYNTFWTIRSRMVENKLKLLGLP